MTLRREASDARSRLRIRDAIAAAIHAASYRGARTFLSSLGVALGACAIVAVLGLSSSSEQALLIDINHLSTLLAVNVVPSQSGTSAPISPLAPPMARRIGPVISDAGIAQLSVSVYRTNLVPADESNGLVVVASDSDLLDPLEGSMAQGSFLQGARAHLPDVVLGALAADRLGINRTGVYIWIGSDWFLVRGILNPVDGAPQIDDSAIVSLTAARNDFQYPGGYSELFVRTTPPDVNSVAAVLPATVNPEDPNAVQVSEASGLLNVAADTQNAFGSLVLALGAVSLVAGGLGVANTMIVAVLERRVEISIRRALGARRRHIGGQFLLEAIFLSVIGGGAGAILGVCAVAANDAVRQWPVSLPWYAVVGPITASLVVGVVAGVYPSLRASQVAPSIVLRAV